MATRQTSATRAKDSDRDDTCRILDNALAEGQVSSAEHRERISAATRAVTLGELHALVTDLQNAAAPVKLPALTRPVRLGGRGLALGALGAAILVGIGIGWGVYGNTSSPLSFTSDPGAKPDGVTPVVLTPPRQLHSLGGLSGLFEQARAKFGDTMGYRLVIYPDYATMDRPDPGEPRRQLSYYYRGGWDDPTSSSSSSHGPAVDLSKFDMKATVGVLRGAPETLGIKASEVKSTYLIIEGSTDPTAPGTLTLSVYVSSDFGSGYIALAGDGSIKRVNYPS
ncbi:DUF1707 SHOCT-like domain-containing protein [[Mycobacterium] vasticus]|uniref:DUF1707 domain-containing protein n=1 Tax=[Mycobacterium] vasticus TaxID=2875777 RepID=A0ABU5YVW6_9MYCO|nr:DUF1707 domain-containing protein [Mycolicibacter sp. MYC017]MEB3069237.1 DUF1707 domain-containing protein [Mycolicibacter sp. MYC017]